MPPSPDTIQSVTEALKSLGLTKYEALVYVALLQVKNATATEIHEISGVPRASVYPVLDRLSGRSLVTVSHTTPKRFAAFPPAEAIDTLMREIGARAEYAKDVLGSLYEERTESVEEGRELIWNVVGEVNITNRIRDLIINANERVDVLGSAVLIGGVQDALRMRAGEIPIEVITDHWDGEVPAGMMIHTKMPPVWDTREQKNTKGGVLFVDGRRVLVVMAGDDEGSTALYSESDGFIRFFSRYWDLVRSYVTARSQK
ncbi:TrmB family transcriptional regulator [Methanofollis fontis]|uniref:TrmB family transcriptional regulator n=1 Tax=Methanofollis fontis TaxID=2052832 RepID=A0A483CW71_9EURY|nr:helix-turn-helix domain-containing protein [Methanofollis fontis]TAJ45817.1 TrmB family transcriptional regulator [Methanofollis fontis]